MKRAMATVAESIKAKEANVCDAEAHRQASSIIRQAADEMSKNPLSYQLHHFDVLKRISIATDSTLVLPDSAKAVNDGLIK